MGFPEQHTFFGLKLGEREISLIVQSKVNSLLRRMFTFGVYWNRYISGPLTAAGATTADAGVVKAPVPSSV